MTERQQIPTLLLTSTGIVPEVRKEFLSLLNKKPSDIHVLSITTAAYGETNNPWWLKKDVELLNECGITKEHIEEYDLKDKTKKEVEKALEGKDIVLVNGGNTFYLLHWARQSGFDDVLKPFLNNGGLYVGISAGTILVNQTIEVAGWKNLDKNKIGLRDMTSLHFVNFLTFVHFTEKYRKIVNDESKKTKLPIVALTDTQALIVKGKNVKLVGTGEKEFWNGFKEVQ